MFLYRAMRYYRLWIYSCNVVLLASCVAFVSVAAWVVSDYRMSLFPELLNLRHPSLLYAYLALLLQGGVLQAIGCVGALRMSPRLLNTYWSLLFLLLCGDALLGAFWIARYKQLSGGLKEGLKGKLQKGYGLDAEYRLLWDRLQAEEWCCGVEGPADYLESEWLKRDRQDYPQRRQLVPRSCCKMKPGPHQDEDVPLNLSCVELGGDLRFADAQLIHSTGCYESVHHWLRHGFDLLCVLGFCVLAFLKLCFVGILRYEIREMIQKIRVLRDMSESPGLLDPGGPAALLPGPAMAARFRRQKSAASTASDVPFAKPNGNNNESPTVVTVPVPSQQQSASSDDRKTNV